MRLLAATVSSVSLIAAASGASIDSVSIDTKLTPPSWPRLSESAQGCSARLSREAALIIDRDIAGRVDPKLLSRDCPLLAPRSPLDRWKRRGRGGTWRCAGKDGKAFSEETWLDLHLRTAHSGDLAAETGQETQQSSICLADFCPLLGCPSLYSLPEISYSQLNASGWLAHVPAAVPHDVIAKAPSVAGSATPITISRFDSDLTEESEDDDGGSRLSALIAEEAAKKRQERKKQLLRGSSAAITEQVSSPPPATASAEQLQLLESYQSACKRLMSSCVAFSSAQAAAEAEKGLEGSDQKRLRAPFVFTTADAFSSFLFDDFCLALTLPAAATTASTTVSSPLLVAVTPARLAGDTGFVFNSPLGRLIYSLFILLAVLIFVGAVVAVGVSLGQLPEEMNLLGRCLKAAMDIADREIRERGTNSNNSNKRTMMMMAPLSLAEGSKRSAAALTQERPQTTALSSSVSRSSASGARLRGRDFVRRSLLATDEGGAASRGVQQENEMTSEDDDDEDDDEDKNEYGEGQEREERRESGESEDGESNDDVDDSEGAEDAKKQSEEYRPAVSRRLAKVLQRTGENKKVKAS